MRSILLFCIFPFLASAANRDIRQISRNYAEQMYPQAGGIDAPWASTKVPKQFHYMHAMVVAAFYAKNAGQREAAMKWIKAYRCENVLACDQLEQFFEGAMHIEKDKAKKKAALEMHAVMIRKVRAMAAQKPPSTGLCAASSRPGNWLELEYMLFCPPRTGPAEKVDTEALKFALEKDSHQLAISSSFLSSLRHIGSADCSAPWTTELACAGGMPGALSFSCEKKGKGYPLRIRCAPAKLKLELPKQGK